MRELLEQLARRGMGWEVYSVSAHRPGSRPLPHCWWWATTGRMMLYDGQNNREWNPLTSDTDSAALAEKLGVVVTGSPAEFWPAYQFPKEENESVQG